MESPKFSTQCFFGITLNIVSISQASKLLLTSCIPHIVLNGSSVSVENQGMHFHSQGSWKKKCPSLTLEQPIK